MSDLPAIPTPVADVRALVVCVAAIKQCIALLAGGSFVGGTSSSQVIVNTTSVETTLTLVDGGVF